MNIHNRISSIDLFCGAGGMTHGFVQAGIPVVAGIDADSACRYPFENNNATIFIEKRIEDVSGDELISLFPKNHIKVLIGCAPCQPFSRYTRHSKKDEKWGLLYDFARLVTEADPDIVTMENVPELARRKSHYVFDDFVKTLKRCGLKVTQYIVKCTDYGVPQSRERLVLFGSKYGKIQLIDKTHGQNEYNTVKDTIYELPSIKAGETHSEDPLHRASSLSELNSKRIKASKPGGTWRDWSDNLIAACHKKKSGKTYSSVYGRMRWDQPSPTITTQAHGYGNGRFGHPDQDRAISLREAALLQSFPKDYDFVGSSSKYPIGKIAMLIGNAVPPMIAEVIAKSIQIHLGVHNA